jgi:hypothetical protein
MANSNINVTHLTPSHLTLSRLCGVEVLSPLIVSEGSPAIYTCLIRHRQKKLPTPRIDQADRFDTGTMSPAFPLNVDTLLPMLCALFTGTCVLAFLIILSTTLAAEFNEFGSFPYVHTLFPARNASGAWPLVITLDAGQIRNTPYVQP